jgi:type II secretory ATPase GspE/PulE/Tfp pilus assembly ATPase PilB-like protein
MDIAERRLAQDGHFTNVVLNKKRDIRAGSGPTIHGERIVLRLMPDAADFTTFEELGLEEEQIARLDAHVRVPYGVILSVGPVGSGKTTLLYACLQRINDPSQSLVTIEDPVERQIAGVNQIQTEAKKEFGFPQALRGVLRQDPNVIMVGEIRDSETAHIACRAGMTGVTVFSTLHANDTAAAIDTFRNFDIPAMFIANSLEAIVSQRLLRKICEECREEYEPSEAELSLLGVDPAEDACVPAHPSGAGTLSGGMKLVRGAGCDACFHTGYLGRTGVFEIMSIKSRLRRGIVKGLSHRELMDIAIEEGMSTLENSALRKVRAGETTIAEVNRVLTTYGE